MRIPVAGVTEMPLVDPKTAKCNTCGEIGHFQCDCKMSKLESRGKTEGWGKPEYRSGKKASGHHTGVPISVSM